MLKIIKRHPTEKWEVSLIELQSGGEKKFKVTRRLPEMSVAETKVFISKSKAKKQLNDWLK